MKFDGLANELGKAIEIIAEKMGVAVEKVYPLLIGQVKVEIISVVLLITVWPWLALAFYVSYKKVSKEYARLNKMSNEDWKAYNAQHKDKDMYSFLSTLFTCLIVVCLMFFIVILVANAKSILTGLYNPDWYIIEYMLMPLIN